MLRELLLQTSLPKGHWAKLYSIVSECHPDTFSYAINLIPTVNFGLMIHCSCLAIATITPTYTTMQLPCQFHIIQNAILNTPPSSNNQDPIHDQLKPPKPPKCPNPSSKTSGIKHLRTSSFAIQIEAIHRRSLSSKAPNTKNESLQKLDMKMKTKTYLKILQGALWMEVASYASVTSTKEIKRRQEQHNNKLTLAMAQSREQKWSGSRRAWEWNATGRETVTGKPTR